MKTSAKKITSTIVILFISAYLCAQISFGEQQIILQNTQNGGVHSADIDGDGDMDILTCYQANGLRELNWLENVDSQGTFERHIIDQWSSGNAYHSIKTADLDGDGDLDIINNDVNGIYWNENLNGLGDFSNRMIVGIVSAGDDDTVVDIDNDGDLDILVGKQLPGHEGLVWYENINGQGDFGPEQVIFEVLVGENNELAINCFDLDEDGDIDILFSSEYRNSITWYRNTGSGNFDSPQFITNIFGGEPKFLKLSDIDGDNDLDLVHYLRINSNSDYILFWCENLNSTNTFGAKQIINQGPNNSTLPSDLDGDADIDIILMYRDQDGIYWHENIDGLGNFSALQTITPNATSALNICTTDIDNDNDLDLLVSSRLDSQSLFDLSWYENTSILSINATDQLNFSLYPIPVSDILHVNSKLKIQTLRVFNNLGQVVQSQIEENNIDLSGLKPDVYILEIVAVYGIIEFRKIIKN